MDNARDKIQKGRMNPMPGSINPGSKLSEENVMEIIEQLDSGASYRAVARLYGVSATAISNISHGAKWSWLTKRERNHG